MFNYSQKKYNCKFYKIVDLEWIPFDASKPEKEYIFALERVNVQMGVNTDYKITLKHADAAVVSVQLHSFLNFKIHSQVKA